MRDLFTATTINLYLTRLQGSIPYCWGQNYTTTYFGTTRGFTRLTQLYLWANNLTGPLPPAMNPTTFPSLTFSVCGNNLQGTSAEPRPAALSPPAQCHSASPKHCMMSVS